MSSDNAKEAAMPKGKLAMYWAASCGGCEISLLGIDEKILDVANAFDLVFCPNLVFTYFDEATQRSVIPRIARRIDPGGILVIGKSESLPSACASGKRSCGGCGSRSSATW